MDTCTGSGEIAIGVPNSQGQDRLPREEVYGCPGVDRIYGTGFAQVPWGPPAQNPESLPADWDSVAAAGIPSAGHADLKC